MAEEKKGHVKFTFEVEINEVLMEVLKESMKNMPEMAKQTWHAVRGGQEREKST